MKTGGLIACGLVLTAVILGTGSAVAETRSFVADLKPVESFVPKNARGKAEFRVDDDGQEIRFVVSVKNIELVTQGHVHIVPDLLKRGTFPRRYEEASEAHQHGKIVGFLMNFERKGVTVNGVLTEGTIRQSDLVGPLRGQPLSLLIGYLERGDIYVALHVLKKIAPGRVFCCPDGLRGRVRPAP